MKDTQKQQPQPTAPSADEAVEITPPQGREGVQAETTRRHVFRLKRFRRYVFSV